jgi:hypothetical protein
MSSPISLSNQNTSTSITPSNTRKVQEIHLKIQATYTSAISQLTHVVNKAKETVTIAFSKIQTTPASNIKIKQIFCAFLSVYSLIGARAFAGGIFPTSGIAFLAATPLVAISGFLFFYAYSLIDYQNPNILKQIQEDAQTLPLPEVINKHGWQNLFTYNILAPNAFTASYCNYANTLSFNQILSLNEYVEIQLRNTKRTDLISSYKIPTPTLWKHKFVEETKHKTPSEIAENYAIEKLKLFEILPSNQIAILEEIKASFEKITKAKETFTNTVSTFARDEHLKSMNACEEATRALQKANKDKTTIGQILQSIKSNQDNFLELSEELPSNIQEEFQRIVLTSHKEFQQIENQVKDKINTLEFAFNVESERVLEIAPNTRNPEMRGKQDLISKAMNGLFGSNHRQGLIQA